MLAVRPKETASMLTRDHVRLDAQIFTVLMLRDNQCVDATLGRAIASTVVYAHIQLGMLPTATLS